MTFLTSDPTLSAGRAEVAGQRIGPNIPLRERRDHMSDPGDKDDNTDIEDGDGGGGNPSPGH